MNPSLPPVTVVGAGYVGLVTAVGLARLGRQVHLVETGAARLRDLRDGRVPIHEAGLQEAFEAALAAERLSVGDAPLDGPGIFLVCVGTPIDEAGISDLRALDAVLADLARRGRPDDIVVIRSTVPVGGTRRSVVAAGLPTARVFANPEFLRQGTAVEDFGRPSRIVVGRFEDADPDALEAVLALYESVDAPRQIVDIEAAEIIKNGANAFLALKLSFTNEIASLCEEAGADAGAVLDGIAADPRIGGAMMKASFGFGGSCLPKELMTLAVAGQTLGLPMHVTRAASAANAAAQDRFAARVADSLGGTEGRKIGLLGLAFKAGTDDVRDSPAVGLAERLIEGGATVRAYDPAAGPNAKERVPALEVVDDPRLVVTGVDAVVIATEWPVFRDLPWADWASSGDRPLIIDGRRLLDPAKMRAYGYDIVQLGDGRERIASAARVR